MAFSEMFSRSGFQGSSELAPGAAEERQVGLRGSSLAPGFSCPAWWPQSSSGHLGDPKPVLNPLSSVSAASLFQTAGEADAASGLFLTHFLNPEFFRQSHLFPERFALDVPLSY